MKNAPAVKKLTVQQLRILRGGTGCRCGRSKSKSSKSKSSKSKSSKSHSSNSSNGSSC